MICMRGLEPESRARDPHVLGFRVQRLNSSQGHYEVYLRQHIKLFYMEYGPLVTVTTEPLCTLSFYFTSRFPVH